MRLNIGQKIFGIAAVVLALMLAVAVYSVHQTAKISSDLRMISGRQLPVTESAARINVHVLEQGILLGRLFIETDASTSDAEAAAIGRRRMAKLAAEVEAELARSRRFLATEESDRDLSPHTLEAIPILAADIDAIEREYRKFEAHSVKLLKAREAGDRAGFRNLLAEHDAHLEAIYAQISKLRRHVDAMASAAVARTDRNERYLLIANSTLTALAAVLGIGFAALVTTAVVATVRSLVRGTERVEAGDLDTVVPVTSRDEVGRLTRSFNDMVGGLRLKERIKETFGKYMDPRIVSNLLDHPEFAEPGGERREMTVMFVDLKGFTSISERLPADQLIHVVNAFFGHVTEAIAEHKGIVDKFMGDAVMAFWGPPFSGADEHAALACRAAVEVVQRLETLRAKIVDDLGAAAAEIDIDLRIGISTGEMVVGTIGSSASRNFTVMGDPVNLGSRLESANKAYGTRIMISERTRELAGDAIVARELDLIRVKGKVRPARVFELIGLAAGAPQPVQGNDDFEAGLAAYRRQDWQAAEAAFRASLAELADDTASRVYLARVAQLRAEPPAADWDGVWVFDSK